MMGQSNAPINIRQAQPRSAQPNYAAALKSANVSVMNPQHRARDNAADGESLLSLFRQLISALLHFAVAKIPQRVRHSTISACGLICLFSPLLLWVAWSKFLLYLLLWAFVSAIAVLYLLITFSPDEYF